MQVKNRRTQRERTQSTRASLIAAARESFVSLGYAGTNTPDIASAAKVTRGALYHHFKDKRDLFHAVVEAEQAKLAADIEAATIGAADVLNSLREGGAAFLNSMRTPGRTRLLLIDALALLTREELDAIDARHGRRTLHDALKLGQPNGVLKPLPIDALAYILSGIYDRAALAIAEGTPQPDAEAVMNALIEGLFV